jgi:hypothetical protein
MSVGNQSLEHTCCISTAVFLLTMVLLRLKTELGMDEVATFPFNKHVVWVDGTPDQVLEGYRLLFHSSCLSPRWWK